MIPKIPTQPSDPDMPFSLRRVQFPVRPAFAMTINKAQGQTLQMAGLFLPTPVFSHGQLYVALSRVGSPGRLKVMVRDGRLDGGPPGLFTQNVVFQDIFA